MQTRMEKYTDAHEDIGYRYQKNEDLYKKISSEDIDNFTVKTNATVLSDNGTNIDIEHIKRILETRYNEAPKRKSITIPEEEKTEEIEQIETKEYDINLILEKAKEEENVEYEKNRYKKLRDTQYDILKDLNLSNNKKETLEKEDEKVDNAELLELINTITQKELENKQKSEDPLDLFPDLKGDDNTVVLEGMQEEITNTLNSAVEEDDETLDKSFYTTTTAFTQNDFDDFEDLKKEVKGHKIALIIVTVIIIVALILGIFFLLNNFLGINFFKK
ncbi:MAG: hypothetical protein J5634_00840 [Bacilli bacterium]|nr:hypothetical protein [Bacilli bacterium]